MAASWQQLIKQAAQAYGTDYALLRAINQREQSGTSNFVINDWDSNAQKGTPSGGPFQFIKPTFDAFARQARAANPQAWRNVPLDWKNPYAQALAASWAIANGKGGHWSTYSKAKADAGKGGGSLGLGDEIVDLGGGQPEAPSYSSRISSLQSARDRLAPKDDGIDDPMGLWSEQRSTRDSLRERTTSLRDSLAAAKQPAVTETHAAGDGHDHGAVPNVNVGSGYKEILRLGQQFGLRIDGSNQTTGGNHAPGSYHYQGMAVDFGDAKNSPEKLRALASWARRNAPRIKEFYYDPLGWFVRDGKIYKGSIGGHGDHVHIAM